MVSMIEKKSGKAKFVFFSALIVLVLDQITKYFVSVNITGPIPVILGVFHLVFIKNTGAGFGLFKGQQGLLIFISVFVVGLILYYYNKIPAKGYVPLSVGLLLGGTIGNLIDRIRLGYVIDFLDFRIWPSFNVADSAITVGAIMLMVYFMKKE
ncbi:MAG: signal peptidase II [Candidatus Woesearchaeota archaeon]|jgi:signal peptidase II|nr:signal peptidase II [Candidatus Woesearchaeota archaeon]